MPEVQKLLRSFVPVADEVGRLQRGKDAECRLFQKFCEEGHYGGRTIPTPTRQGIYAITSSGVFLGSCNTRSAKRVITMLEEALKRFGAMSRGQRAIGENGEAALAAVRRFEDRFPKDGLALRVVSRDLPGAAKHRPYDRAWNLDWAWFRKAEALAMLPGEERVGATKDIPKDLVMRLARFHLVDNVRGQTSSYRAGEVEEAELSCTLRRFKAGRWTLGLEGKTRASAGGKWPRGLAVTLRGEAVWDTARQRFTKFELVAVGKRWGRTKYNARAAGDDREPIGFVLTLAEDAPSSRVAPAHIWAYGW